MKALKEVTSRFKKACPDKKVVYYSKHTHLEHIRRIEDDNIDNYYIQNYAKNKMQIEMPNKIGIIKNYLQHRINFIAGFLLTCESPRGLSWLVIIY